MAVAKDAVTTSGLTSFTHTPVGTPAGVLVGIVMANAADVVTGVTYGGVAMTEVANSPLVASGAEGGTCYGYILGSSVPTGAQTVAVSVTTGTPRTIVQTVTAAANTEIITTNTINETGVTGDRTGTLSLGGRTGVVLEVVWSSTGAVTGANPLTGWTAAVETDEGAETNYRYTYDTVGSSDVTFGATHTTTDDIAVLAMAIGEVAGGATYTLDVGAAAYDYTASDASLEFGRVLVPDVVSYAYTANDVTLSRDMSIVPDAAAYTYTANDVSLEFGRQIVIDTVSYDWTPTDVDLTYTPAGTTYNLIPDSAAYAWAASDVTFDYVSLASPYRSPSGSRPKDYERRVRRKWEEIEEIERRIKAKEEAEREKIRKQEEAKRQLAELEEKKRQTKTIAERKRKLEARIEAYQSEITELRQEMIALLEEIERARVEQELQQTIADRRRRMLLLLAVAA